MARMTLGITHPVLALVAMALVFLKTTGELDRYSDEQ